jgi:hypothetical protein
MLEYQETLDRLFTLTKGMTLHGGGRSSFYILHGLSISGDTELRKNLGII